jgi:hypothetical protein
LQKSNPPSILVEATGTVGTPGWRNIRLDRLEKVLSADGILDLDFVGDPPTGIVPQVVRPANADFIIDPKEAEKIVGVLVHSRTGNLLGTLGTAPPAPAPNAFTTAALAGNLGIGTVTTLALGEEGQTKPSFGEDISTRAIGEEDFWHTFAGHHAESPPLTPQIEKMAMSHGEKFPQWHNEKIPRPPFETLALIPSEKSPVHKEIRGEEFVRTKLGIGEGDPGPDPFSSMFFSPFGVR